jgi:hypothetical protein
MVAPVQALPAGRHGGGKGGSRQRRRARRIKQLPGVRSRRSRRVAGRGSHRRSAHVHPIGENLHRSRSPSARIRASRPTMAATAEEIAMTQEESRETAKKTPIDHLADTLAQLKEMRHYSKNNVEHLTATWMLFDGELKKLKRTDKIEDLMNRQGQLHDALEAVIADLEDALKEMQPVAAE